MRNIALGRYIPGNSFLHRLDPRLKILLLILSYVIIFLPNLSLESYVLLVIIYVLTAKLSGIGLRGLLKTLKIMWFMFLFLLIINAFIRHDGPVLFTISSFSFHLDAIKFTVEIIVRMFLLITISTLLSATTKPLDLTFSLEWYLHPLKIIRFPSHEIAMIISLALRFIPTTLEDAGRIMKAQESRGVDFQNGKLKERIVAMISLIIPLFIASFERADDLALAMDSRGYDSRAKRTRFRQFHFHFLDLLGLLLGVALLVFFIYFKDLKIIPFSDIERFLWGSK